MQERNLCGCIQCKPCPFSCHTHVLCLQGHRGTATVTRETDKYCNVGNKVDDISFTKWICLFKGY